MKHTLEPLLTVTDIMVIFLVSRVTIYRWNRLAKEGRSRFPCAVSDTKQGLRWNPDDIRAFQNANRPPPKIETASSRAKRHVDAMNRLEKKGVKFGGSK